MININTPQRFYQISHGDGLGKLETVVDLKEIIEITLSNHSNGRSSILMAFKNGNMGRPFEIRENLVVSEEYAKIVTAWTTYKLASE